MSVLIFILVLGILIAVHEWGHMVTAKAVGVRVEQYALGFGPKLWSFKHKGTDYMIRAFPLGGYVKMAGDDRNNLTGEKYEFYSQSSGRRALIVLMGPMVNFILAYLCFCFVFFIGYPDLSAKVGQLIDKSPAKVADLQKNDRIVSIDNQPVESWGDIKRLISDSHGSQVHLVIDRKGQQISKNVAPKVTRKKNIFGQIKETRVIGIAPEEEIILLKYPFGKALVKAGEKLWEITALTFDGLYSMLTGWISPKGNITGPVGIFIIIKHAAEMGISQLMYIVGVISASLAIFNVLPFPVLDGGHLALLGIERIRGKAVPEKFEENLTKVGISLLLCLLVFVIYSDISTFNIIGKIKSIFK